MKKISSRTKLLAAVAVSALVLVGCSSDDASETASKANDTVASATDTAGSAAADAGSEQGSASKATLADWDGSYRSLASYIEDPEMQEGFEEAAKEHGEDVATLKGELNDKYGIDFEGLVVDGDTLTFVKQASDLENPSETAVEYKYVESIDDSFNGHDFTWHVFEAQGDAEYKYAVMMEKHGEELLEHFHARFGDDKDALLAEEKFPTFINPDSATQDQIQEELLEHAH